MPRKLRNPKARIETEMTEFEREWFLDEGWGCFLNPTLERRAELWAEYSGEILEQYRQKNGLFRRPGYWWENVAPVQCRQIDEEHTETQKSYFLQHPELQTPEEMLWLCGHQFSRWELMPASEIADLPYLQAHPQLLNATELEAMREHVLTAAAGSGLIQ